MTKTPQDIIKERYEKHGNITRFADLSASRVGEEPEPGYLDWYGQPKVVGTNDNLAGVLIDEETIMLLDVVQEKIIQTGHSVIMAFTNSLRPEHDAKRNAEIMTLYQRLVNESLKRQFTKAAG
jgi:hypothetical protein